MGNQTNYRKQQNELNNNNSKSNQEVSSKQSSSNSIPLLNEMQQSNPFSKIIKFSDLTVAFKRFAIDGLYLNYDKFNECIAFLLKFDVPLICHTFLAERLFQFMDKNCNGKIFENDFVEDMKIVFSSREAKIRLSFDAISTLKNKQYIEFNELLQYFITSWNYGFRILYNILNLNQIKDELFKNNIPIPAKNQLDFLIERSVDDLRNYLMNSFVVVGIKDPSHISYETFKMWIAFDHTLEISYFNKRVRVAIDLMCLDDIGLNLNS